MIRYSLSIRISPGSPWGAGPRGRELGKFLDSLDRNAHYDLKPTCLLISTKQLVKMLYLVGLGLSDETDITVKGLEVVKKASRVYLEAYTSILLVNQTVLVSSRPFAFPQ